MIYIFIISNISAFISLLIYHTHIFQLNSYNEIEENNWLRENYYPILGRNLGLIISALFIFIFSFKFQVAGLIIATILNILTAILNREKNSKIPLKYTNRVKRMLFTVCIMYIIMLLFLIIGHNFLYFAVLEIICMITPYMLLLSNTINKPVEKHINDGFINDAKRKINSMNNLTVIGVTGSYGKTSVKHILGKLLSKDYNVLITPGNYNTTLGVVITIREHLSPIHDIFVCEMGAKSLGEIKEICDIVNPRYGIITSIGMQHLETFLSLDNIITTKFELAEALPDSGTVFLNYDNEYIVNHHINKNTISYAVDNKNSNFVPYDLQVDENGSSFKLNIDNTPALFKTKVIGKHNVLNITGCIAVAHELGVDTSTLIQRVAQLEQVEHRQQIIKKDFGLIIDDAYNSNPSGAKSALDTLSMFDMTKIVVTPGMIELGDKQYELNKEFGKQIADVADYIILVGKKQTLPIQDGIKEKNYDEKNLFIEESMQKALSLAYTLKTDKQKAILIENDLPDNY